MMNYTATRPFVLLVAGILLFTFCQVPEAHADIIFGGIALAVLGVSAVVGAVIAPVKATRDQPSVKKEQPKESTEAPKPEFETQQLPQMHANEQH